MRLSAKTQYACLAMLDLASRYSAGDSVRAKSIAEAHAIPVPFLLQILNQLKSAGLVTSSRGATGGYRLAMLPHDVTLCDVIDAIEPAPAEGLCVNQSPMAAVLAGQLQLAEESARQAWGSVTLATLCEQLSDPKAAMYYI